MSSEATYAGFRFPGKTVKLTLLGSLIVLALVGLTGVAGIPQAEAAVSGIDTDAPSSILSDDASDTPQLPGWPITITTGLFLTTGITAEDLDRDGYDEVIVGGSDGRLHVWRHDGTPMPGFPRNLGGRIIMKIPAADLDGDGDRELVVALLDTNRIWVIHHDGSVAAGWPKVMPADFLCSPIVRDLDRDGSPEVIFGCDQRIYAWRGNGEIVPGFPLQIPANPYHLAAGDFIPDPAVSVRTPDRPEIIASTLRFTQPSPLAVPSSLAGGLCRPQDDATSPPSPAGLDPGTVEGEAPRTVIWEIYCIHADGHVAGGWPVDTELDNIGWGGATLGDLEGDGQAELMITGYLGYGFDAELQVYEPSGEFKPGFPVPYVGLMAHSSVVPADADQDGDLEIFIVAPTYYGGNGFYAFDHEGETLPNWPKYVNMNCPSSPIVADLDGDPECEMVAPDGVDAAYAGYMWAYNVDGTDVDGFPLQKASYPGANSPAVADLDADGDVEILLVTNYTNQYSAVIDIYDLDAPYHPERSEWGSRFHDNWNTSEHGFVIPEWGLRMVEAAEPVRAATWRRMGIRPNPTSGPVQLVLDGAWSRPEPMLIFDAAGGIIRRLPSAPASDGRLEWDGRDEVGTPVAAGVYYVRPESGGTEPARIVVIR